MLWIRIILPKYATAETCIINLSVTKLFILFMRPERFTAWFLTVFSLPALSISDRCNRGSILHSFDDSSERCCQPVTVPPGYERRICKEVNGKAEYEQCSPRTYQNTNYPSNLQINCEPHSECSKPNMVVHVPGNSISNNVCKCNEADGYKTKNAAGGTDTLEAYHCLHDGSQNGISNITSTTTESPSNTTETAGTARYLGTIIAIPIVITFAIAAFILLFLVKTGRLNISTCRRIRRGQGGPNDTQATSGIRAAAADGEKFSVVISTEPTDGPEEGDAVGNGHVTSNGTCLQSTPLLVGIPETDEPQNAVGNGHVTSNGSCFHRTPSSAGLPEDDQQEYLFDLRPDVHSSLCEQPNT